MSNSANTTPQRGDLARFFESPEDLTETRLSQIAPPDRNLALLASMRKPKRSEDSPNNAGHIDRFLETGDASKKTVRLSADPEPGSPVSSDSDSDEVSAAYVADVAAERQSSLAARMSIGSRLRSEEESSAQGDTTETTGLGRAGREDIRGFFEGGAVQLNGGSAAQSFNDTESSIGGGGGGGGGRGDGGGKEGRRDGRGMGRRERRVKESDDDEDDLSSVSYNDDSAASESASSVHGGDAIVIPPPHQRRITPVAIAPSALKKEQKNSISELEARLPHERIELLDEIASVDYDIAKSKRGLSLDMEVTVLRMELEAKERILNCIRMAKKKG